MVGVSAWPYEAVAGLAPGACVDDAIAVTLGEEIHTSFSEVSHTTDC